ncbi:copper amine oxidase N-terminal domain-containing protein [Paenibacillus sp. 2TAB19]|uniref:copper amine oxidase N-terminal domain-containing protein n=1 Tax=Paenibacillus sp. 2TAB19 TaxID=3233003 RepID=UPI003F960484
MIKKMGRPSKLMLLLLTLVLVFVSGCQAIGGVDLNTVLKNTLKVTSSESKQTLTFKMQLDDEALNDLLDEEIAIYKLLSKVELQLDHVKMEDSMRASFDGKLTLGDSTSIGFAMKMNESNAIVEIEGAKQPFVLDMTGESLAAEFAGVDTAANASADGEESLAALGHAIIDTVGGYAIDNLPNPEKIDVKPVTETINGESVALMQVHAEMDGKAIWAWVKKYVDALVADQAGLEKMIKGIVEVLSSNPDVWEALGTVNPFEESGQLDAPTTDELIQQAIDEAVIMLKDLQDELKAMESEDPELIDTLLGDNLNVKADVYVDSKLDIRKQGLELSYTLPVEEDEELSFIPVKGFTLTSVSELWNVNGDVLAEPAVVPATYIDENQLLELSDYQLLKLFKEDSAVYDILRNKLHLNRQSVSFYVDSYYNPPIVVKGGITLVPLRPTAEALGSEIQYDPKTKAITLYDEATETTIELKTGSDKVLVNGVGATWSFPVTSVDGTAYVPARSLSNALNAKLAWQDFYGEKSLTIAREV